MPAGPGLPGLPELLAGFAHGGDWEGAAPCALLAAALEAVAGPDGLYEGAGTDALVGIAGRWAAIESWAAAELLGTLRVLGRDADPALTRPGLPDGWDDSLVYELSAALAMGPVSAGNLAALAWALGARLPLTGRLLADGTLSRAKAKLIAAVFDPLDDQQAARAEALIAGEVPGKTYPQIERLAWRAALAIAPDIAERRRKAAERNQARVTVFREESGAVGLSGRDLPAAQALSGHARVLDRAREYAESGAFPGERENRLEALAYLHLLNGVSAADAIAFARTGAGEDGDVVEGSEPARPVGGDTAPPAGPARNGNDHDHDGHDDDGDGDDHDDDGGGDGDGHDDDGGGGPGGSGPDDGSPDSRGPQGRESDGRGSDGRGRRPDDGPQDDDERGGPEAGGPGPRGGPAHGPGPGPGLGPGPRDGEDDSGGGRPAGQAIPRRLPEVTIPLATLLGLAERPGESRLLGAVDPALARALAAAAARSPASRWEVTVVDDRGHAAWYARARPDPASRASQASRAGPPRQPGRGTFPARVNLTLTQAMLRDLAAPPRPGAPPGPWHLAPREPGNHGTPGTRGTPGTTAPGGGPWALTLPGGTRLTLRLDTVPVHDCDHAYQVGAYLPGDRLRRLVGVRDHQCTFPTCSRPADRCDFEHAIPYDQGGRTCACNAGARSRRCHRVKQAPGWTLTQPQPGYHQWTTPTGRSYVRQPWRYLA